MRQQWSPFGKYAAAFGLATSLLSQPAPAAELWNFYTIQSAPNYSSNRAAAALAEEIGKVTNGQITVRRHLAGTLQIQTSNMAAAVGENAVQMGEDILFGGIVPIGSILRLPFLINTMDEFNKASAIVWPYVEQAYASKGVVLLAQYVSPTQYFWSGKKELKSLADFKGLKIRTSNPEQSEVVRQAGGSSISIPPADVPASLDRGVVDGIITGSVGVELWKDLLKYGYLLGVNYNHIYIIANAESFNKLSDDFKAKVRKAAKESGEWTTNLQATDDAAILANLPKWNISAVKPSDEDMKKAVGGIAPYWEEWTKSRGPQFVEVLGKVRAALNK
jgi:TRAP-type C4-dicarboxylate transport system substrate-binding protein